MVRAVKREPVEETIDDVLREIVLSVIEDVVAYEVTNDAAFFEQLGADSLDLMEIAILAEERYGIEISNDEMEEITTFGDFLRIVKGKVEQNTL